ncbi:hypothetical protein ACFL6S_00715 [Candidatus Poribacteria bacterium]
MKRSRKKAKVIFKYRQRRTLRRKKRRQFICSCGSFFTTTISRTNHVNKGHKVAEIIGADYRKIVNSRGGVFKQNDRVKNMLKLINLLLHREFKASVLRKELGITYVTLRDYVMELRSMGFDIRSKEAWTNGVRIYYLGHQEVFLVGKPRNKVW